jgi:phage terminase large subunit-like protein
MITLQDWRAAELEIEANAAADGSPLLDLLPPSAIAEMTDLECLALLHSPAAYLRPAQLPPTDDEWLVWLLLCGRGWGKSLAAAGWIIDQVLAGDPSRPADYVLVGPKLEDCWTLQWRTIKSLLPPWLRYVERIARNSVLFPDKGVELFLHSAELEYRGGNLRGAWVEEPVRFSRGAELWSTLRLVLTGTRNRGNPVKFTGENRASGR